MHQWKGTTNRFPQNKETKTRVADRDMKNLNERYEQTVVGLSSRALDEWAPRRAVAELVLQTVRTIDWTQPGADERLARGRTAGGEVILAILTHCYAIGIYRSQEIEQRILRRKAGRDLFLCVPLDWKTFAQFRRHNRALVKQCLMNVLQQSFRVRWNNNAIKRAEALGTRFSALASATDARFLHLLAWEAERRIALAVELDYIDQDE